MDAREKLDAVLERENALSFSSFSLDDAWRLGSLLVRKARERSLPIAIDVRLGTQQAFHAAMPGATANNDDWVERKVRVVQAYDRSSLGVRLYYEALGTDFDTFSRRDPNLYAAFGGGVPIRIGDTLIGVVAVSGLPHEDDHDLVVEALEELLLESD